jgi:hypothetical protein
MCIYDVIAGEAEGAGDGSTRRSLGSGGTQRLSRMAAGLQPAAWIERRRDHKRHRKWGRRL